MSAPHYPDGTVRALLDTDLVTEATRAALESRLQTPSLEPQFFDGTTYELLRAVAARLFPQPDRTEPIELAALIDERLLTGQSDGWRYDALPPDREAYRLGLGGINESAQLLFQQSFLSLAPEQQDAVLTAVQHGEAPGKTWETLPAVRFFEELLAELTENYYAHPLAQEEIGYVGMADVPGWHHLGLNALDPREPEAQ
ncbi:gluconate 2-dehydrogenase subunit 3 family protein [Hymenobacter sp. GOD-10R]|uniref:gluconate 2-dehydrogenase subunit 3 family protein n=1 Tax=Hymenobacter sp. GOD-10R TaxID=3093922 RepID=UPI002D78A0F5|nr:gluconate 2-dehydrogenase subunit 3 family protein [Hymenobacter sp. GOD-10R]WRQ28839.1 gluconate 2-dehydrogenase subunit 3 family protein [Hymenobacter sp. GOD-10R]